MIPFLSLPYRLPFMAAAWAVRREPVWGIAMGLADVELCVPALPVMEVTLP